MKTQAVYPAHYEADVVLRDGSTLRLRPVRDDDAAGVRALYNRLLVDSRRFRFFTAGPSADA